MVDLFDFAQARARATDPDTSHEAAESVGEARTRLQQEVLAYLRSIYPEGCTDLDLQGVFANHRSTYRTRRSELVDAGLVERIGKIRQDGSNRIVWRATAWRKTP